MKPLHLNLASRPYRDYKPLYAVVVAGSLLIAFLMLNNVDTYYRYINETQSTRAKIAELDRQTEQEHHRTEAADAQLRGVNLTALDLETRFINARLAERAFSWSELLDRLEGVLPDDVRLRSISQTFQATGYVHLEMTFEGKAPTAMLETLDRFRTSPYFTNAFPRSESMATTGYTFNMGADFKPSIARIVEK